LIVSDDYGLLIPPADPEALGDALLCGLEKVWDTEGIERHGQRYTWGRVADQLIGLYEEVLASRRDSRGAHVGLHDRLEPER
jgi:glycosyltransferase involved in cell wall biosynthesis